MASIPALLALATLALVPLAIRAIVRRAPAAAAARLTGVPVPLSTVVALGATTGGLGGLLAALHLTLRHLVEGELARGFSWDVLWMAPASGALAAGLLALPLAVAFPAPAGGTPATAGRGPGHAVMLAPCLVMLVALAAHGVLQDPRLGLHPASAALLALGLAALAVRRVGRHSPAAASRGIRLTARALLPMIALLVGAGLWHLPRAREARALAALPAAPAGRPNILLLVLDTVRAASLGLYGHGRPTSPHLERLARQGTMFDWAIATAPWTLPSHASMFTGRYPGELGVGARTALAERHLTLAEALSARGYATAGFVANLAYTTRISGLAQGFGRYEDRPMTWGRFIESAWLPRTVGRALLPLAERPWRGGGRRKDARQNVDDFLRWLDGRREPERPFFAFLNFIDAHDPYFAPSRLRGRFGPPGERVVAKRRGLTEASLASTRAAYEASIAFIDEQVGRVAEELSRRGIAERTLVIVTSDHGEHFGEHGLQLHGNSLYRPLVRVPLVIVYPPGVPAGRRVATPVSIRDIARSVLEVATDSVGSTFPGRSLVAVARRADSAAIEPLLSLCPEAYLAEPWEPAYRRSLRSVFRFPYHLIRDSEGGIELYRVDLDPTESRDLAAGADRGLLASLQTALDSLSPPPP